MTKLVDFLSFALSCRFMTTANMLFVKIFLLLFHSLGSQEPTLFKLLLPLENTLVLLLLTIMIGIQELISLKG